MTSTTPLLRRLGIAGLLAGMALLSGCASSLVSHRNGSDSVAVLDANEVSKCQAKGSTSVSVLSEVGFFTRSADAVEANLLQLARNSAVDADADTVVKGSSMQFGKRSFDLYKCR